MTYTASQEIVPIDTTVYRNVRCDKCNEYLEHSFPNDEPVGGHTTLQFKNALVLEPVGGFDMYIDPLFKKPSSIILCGKCASLFEDWLDRAL